MNSGAPGDIDTSVDCDDVPVVELSPSYRNTAGDLWMLQICCCQNMLRRSYEAGAGHHGDMALLADRHSVGGVADGSVLRKSFSVPPWSCCG